jgi:curved DNA-binding protein CbpA
MKDYYKILGVKETASMDEIRDRWVELVREFHPDQGKEVAPENEEKVRDINEAYQALKHSSTRVEYDLKKAFERRKKRLSFKKLILPAGAAVVLIIAGGAILYFGRSEDSSISGPIISSNKAPGLAEQSGSVPQDAHAEKVTPSAKSKAPPEPERVASPEQNKNLPEKRGEATRSQQGDSPKTDPRQPSQPTYPQGRKASLIELHQVPQETAKVVAPEAPQKTTDKAAPTVEGNAAAVPLSVVTRDVTPEAKPSPHVSAAFIAEKDEIRQFLAQYKERYTQRDPAAFLQLFSPSAVQNHTQNMDDIRTIYRAFFEQSKDLQYDMEDTLIEIYENAAEVKARFRINQTLKSNGEKRFWKGPIRWVLVKEDAVLKIGMLDYQLAK